MERHNYFLLDIGRLITVLLGPLLTIFANKKLRFIFETCRVNNRYSVNVNNQTLLWHNQNY